MLTSGFLTKTNPPVASSAELSFASADRVITTKTTTAAISLLINNPASASIRSLSRSWMSSVGQRKEPSRRHSRHHQMCAVPPSKYCYARRWHQRCQLRERRLRYVAVFWAAFSANLEITDSNERAALIWIKFTQFICFQTSRRSRRRG